MNFVQTYLNGSYSFNNGARGNDSAFEVRGKNVEATIDGVSYKGNESIVTKNGVVYVDGVSQGAHKTLPISQSYDVKITGTQIDSVSTAGSANVNGNVNNLNTGGSANVSGNVQTLSAGGSASIGGNAGTIKAGGSVNLGNRY